MESGEERDVEIPVCFVSCGKFDVRAEIHVFEASQDERVAGKGQLTAIVREKLSAFPNSVYVYICRGEHILGH
jgi:hypothetical protein